MDIKALAENLGLEEDEYLELADLLVETGLVDLSIMESALEGGDADAAAKAAHSLKGASGNLGIMDIYELAQNRGSGITKQQPLIRWKSVEGDQGKAGNPGKAGEGINRRTEG